MKVEVRLFAQFRELGPREGSGVFPVDLPEGSSGNNLIDQLRIPRNRPIILMLNGRREPESTPLTDGDRIALFPPVGGG